MATEDEPNPGVPDFTIDPVTHILPGEYPLVKAGDAYGDVYGYAIGYTSAAVNVQWEDATGRVRVRGFPANRVERVSEADWHGHRMWF